MSSEDGGKGAFEENTSDLEAFEAQFQLGDFAGWRTPWGCGGLWTQPESLSCLRRTLLPEFRFFLASCPGENWRAVCLQSSPTSLNCRALCATTCRKFGIRKQPERGRGVQRATQEPRCRAGRRPDALPDRELYPTWHPLPRPRSFPEDADSERLLDGYFEPRLGYFKLTLKRRHARDFAKGAVRPRRASQRAR
jgi:hypothetical protein